MTPGLLIRQAAQQDAEAIARLSGSLGYAAEPAVIAKRVAAIASSRSDLLIVSTNSAGQIIGWLQAHASTIVESGFRVEITGLIVAEGERRLGAGRALVAAAEQWAKSIQAEVVVVRSNVQRAESHKFYPALGYSAAKTQHVYRKRLSQP